MITFQSIRPLERPTLRRYPVVPSVLHDPTSIYNDVRSIAVINEPACVRIRTREQSRQEIFELTFYDSV